MTTNPLIHTQHISFRYNQELILHDVDFQIEAGEFVGIVGPNGGGKTTLLKIMLGLLVPEQGQITAFGQPVRLGDNAAKIGYVPQKVTQLATRFPITVEEVVLLGRINRKKLFQPLNAEDKKMANQALEMVDLLPLRKKLITDLSGGQQQRAFIAKALAGEPELLILDEPTVGIDFESEENFYSLLAELNKKHGLTVVIVSHDVDVVMNEVSSVLCLNKTLIYHGNPKQFIKDEYLEKLYGKNKRYITHGH